MFFVIGFIAMLNCVALVCWPIIPIAIMVDYLFYRSIRQHARQRKASHSRYLRRRAVKRLVS